MRRVLRTPSPPPWESQVKTLQSPTGPLSASATLGLVWDCNCQVLGHLSQGSFQSEAEPPSYRYQGYRGMGWRLDGASCRTVLSAGKSGMSPLHFHSLCLLQKCACCLSLDLTFPKLSERPGILPGWYVHIKDRGGGKALQGSAE